MNCCTECGSLERPVICTREAGTTYVGGRVKTRYDYGATYACNLCLMIKEAIYECDYERRRYTLVGVGLEGEALANECFSRCPCGRASIYTKKGNYLCPSCNKELRMLSKAEVQAKRLMIETRQLLKLLKEK